MIYTTVIAKGTHHLDEEGENEGDDHFYVLEYARIWSEDGWPGDSHHPALVSYFK